MGQSWSAMSPVDMAAHFESGAWCDSCVFILRCAPSPPAACHVIPLAPSNSIPLYSTDYFTHRLHIKANQSTIMDIDATVRHAAPHRAASPSMCSDGSGGGVEVVVLGQSRSAMSPVDMAAHFESGEWCALVCVYFTLRPLSPRRLPCPSTRSLQPDPTLLD